MIRQCHGGTGTIIGVEITNHVAGFWIAAELFGVCAAVVNGCAEHAISIDVHACTSIAPVQIDIGRPSGAFSRDTRKQVCRQRQHGLCIADAIIGFNNAVAGVDDGKVLNANG